MAIHNREEFRQTGTFPREARGWCPTLGILTLEICPGEMSSQKYLVRKPEGPMSKEPKVLEETEILLLKGLCVDSLNPGFSTKVPI